jgi:hypothetical protein
MAGKDGADIPAESRNAIATYLASLSNQSATSGGKSDGSSGGETPAFTLAGTLSPMWRGGGSTTIQNPGFFPMAWVGVNWQGSGPISGRATSCISCHNEVVSRLELVEAAARFDLTKCARCLCSGCDDHKVEASVEAGRFVVPFGAFYQQVNPGVYRTVTVPLIYNMGQRIYPGRLPVSVLPMPYADEGAAMNFSAAISDDLNATFNGYAVNGLRGSNDIDFVFGSRDYVDNNRYPSVGGRVTIGGTNLRGGASVMGGQYNPDEGIGPNHDGLSYWIYGADATYRWRDVLRIQFEYARRDTQVFFFFPDNIREENHIYGCYVEGEVLLCRCYHLSFVTRYNFQGWSSAAAPSSGLQPTKANERVLTLGLDWTLPGGSLLMVGDDHWFAPAPLRDVDVFGVRWAVTF